MTLRLHRFVPDLDEDNAMAWQAIDYVTSLPVRLHKDVLNNLVQGEVRTVRFFDPEGLTLNADGTVATGDVIVREDHVYVRDANDLATSRTATITWIQEDDTDHPATKTRVKIYSPLEQIREGLRRRGNIIDKLKLDIIGLLMVTEPTTFENALVLAQVFWNTHSTRIKSFIDAADPQLVTDVTGDSTSWLDNVVSSPITIRDVILAEIS